MRLGERADDNDCMNRIGLFAAWIAATGLATALAWQVVGAADDQISDAPTTPLIALTAPESTTGPSTEPGTSDPQATTPSTASTSTTVSSSSTTTSNNATSTTTSVPGSTTTSTSSGTPATTTAVSDGGTVTVSGVDPSVELVAVVAAPGWSYRVTGDDGTRVEVTFTNVAGSEIRVRCEWDDGRLEADIDS